MGEGLLRLCETVPNWCVETWKRRGHKIAACEKYWERNQSLYQQSFFGGKLMHTASAAGCCKKSLNGPAPAPTLPKLYIRECAVAQFSALDKAGMI